MLPRRPQFRRPEAAFSSAEISVAASVTLDSCDSLGGKG